MKKGAQYSKYTNRPNSQAPLEHKLNNQPPCVTNLTTSRLLRWRPLVKRNHRRRCGGRRRTPPGAHATIHQLWRLHDPGDGVDERLLDIFPCLGRDFVEAGAVAIRQCAPFLGPDDARGGGLVELTANKTFDGTRGGILFHLLEPVLHCCKSFAVRDVVD